MQLALKITLALTLLWGGALFLYSGMEIGNPATFLTTLLAPICLLWLAYGGVMLVVRESGGKKEKDGKKGAKKPNKPLSEMQLYEIERLKSEQQLNAAEAARGSGMKMKSDIKQDPPSRKKSG